MTFQKKFAHIHFLKWVFSSRDRCLTLSLPLVRIDVVKKFKWKCILVLLSLQTDNGFGCFMFHAISDHVLQSYLLYFCPVSRLPFHFRIRLCLSMLFCFRLNKNDDEKVKEFLMRHSTNHFTRPRKWFSSAVVAISQERHLLFTSHENFKSTK